MTHTASLGLRHAALECQSLESALQFYQEMFGMQVYLDTDKDWAMLQLGDTYLSLVPVEKRSAPVTQRGSHAAHLGLVYPNESAVEQTRERLVAKGVKPVGALTRHRDGSYGFYCTDLDGNVLECIFIPHRSHTKVSKAEAWVLLGHGSRDPLWAKPMEKIKASLERHVPSVRCEIAFMEFGSPSLMDVVGQLSEQKIEKVKVFPVFLSNGGGHMGRDIPELVSQAKAAFPSIHFSTASAMGEHSIVVEAFVSAIVRTSESML
jgi:sirohydrochlorin cobaltochelatase